MPKQLSITISEDVFEHIEKIRGLVNRSEYYEYLMRTNPVYLHAVLNYRKKRRAKINAK